MRKTESVHGHEVMEMMITSGKTWTRESLVVAIHQKFGTDARFHTCSADGMTAAELIDFLDARGKFDHCGDGFTTAGSHVCSH
ncbi:MAG: YecH family protein [Proteobacteria bacterium]|nr:YecH family protein [Pseudomonadota bacterium]MCL2309126.1 YecH family protein [Pseudomonadota bacterium]